ncbi:hypothetical protein FIBSPDRAFT_906245, partial [Athelia psychrophila]
MPQVLDVASRKSFWPVSTFQPTFTDNSEIHGDVSSTTPKLKYDYPVHAGVQEHTCYMKELHDAKRMPRQFMDCVDGAAFPGQGTDEVDRLLHMRRAARFPRRPPEELALEPAGKIRITLVEALPSVLPVFFKQLIDYTKSTFKESKFDILTQTMVKEVKEKSVVLQMPDRSIVEVPCRMAVWAAGNKGRHITQDLMGKLRSAPTNSRVSSSA